MPPNKSQSNYSKRPVRRVRLPKIGPRNTKSLFEEYFYWFVGAISLAVMILGKAGGMNGYDAVVLGLWIAGFMWSASVLRRYRKEQAGASRVEKSKQEMQTTQLAKNGMPVNMKPIIGPQWPLKGAPVMRKSMRPTAPVQTVEPQTPPSTPPEKKRAFVYERPTLPDRKPKFPANWAGKQDKKPKP